MRMLYLSYMIQIFGRSVRGWKLILFGAVFVIGLSLLFFVRQVWVYYDAIRSGKSNPILEQRMESSWSKLVANNKVGAEDLARLTASQTGTLGTKGAKLTIVEFLDFDCPFCRASFSPVREMIQKYNKQVYFIVRDFPLEELHPRAIPSALAARCAAAQDKFWAYHDKLYIDQDHHEDADLERYARETGLDTVAFDQCYQHRTFAAAIQQDVQDGLRVGVQGTPTFFFNGVRVQGQLDGLTLEYLIQRFLKASDTK